MSEGMAREPTPTILIADDQADVREALRLLLKAEGIASHGVADPAAALEAARRREFACALIDCNYSRDTTSGEEGLDLLEKLRQAAPELPVVAMTAWGNVPLTVAAMRCGAADFIEKPWDNARLLSVLRAQAAPVGGGERAAARRGGRGFHRRVGGDAPRAGAHRAHRAQRRQRAGAG